VAVGRNRQFDVIVVGLGAMGSAASYQLARRGARVLGLDRYAPPHAFGSSHGESRITRLALGEGAAYVPLATRSHEIWRELEEATGSHLFQQNGVLIYGETTAASPMHGNRRFFETTVDMARRFGIPHELLDAAEIRRRFPQFRVGPDDGGFYEPGAGTLFPERCIEAQLQQARQLDADLRFDVRVLGLLDGDVPGVVTDDATFTAPAVIVTAGAWVGDFLPDAVRGRFRVHRQVLGWYRPHAEPERHLAATMPNWVRLPSDGEELVYGLARVDAATDVKVASEQFEVTCDPEHVTRTVTEDETRRLHEAASQALDLDPVPTRSAACLYTVTPDSHFVIDRHPTRRGVLVVSPCSGHGFKNSAAIGEAVAQWALGQEPMCDLNAFRFDRFGR
jgi:sarcosine oxidase